MSFDIPFIIDHLPLIFLLAGMGMLAGFLAGLLGIGGGIVLVPALYYSLISLGYEPEHMMHLAVGTSLAIILPTGLSSVRAHWRRQSVDFDLAKNIGVGILIGSVGGTVIAGQLSREAMQVVFGIAIMILAAIMVSNPARFKLLKEVPPQPWTGIAGSFIGGLATMMGIGGAVMSVPFMTICNVKMHKAVGTASALGLVIAVPGTIGFIIIGWGQDNLPPLSVGYINLLAWALIIPFTVAIAPLGARAAHALPVEKLRLAFACFMVIISLRMLWSVFGHA